MVYLRRLSVVASLLAFCSCFALRANASTFTTSGTFAADNSTFEYNFTDSGAAIFTAATNSYGSGFVPVLTLYNDSTGLEIDNSGSGLGDASLSDILNPGTYDLFLTEFPNVAVNNLADGFLFSADPSATGDLCGVSGGMFYDVTTCNADPSASYALTASTAPTPEPATWLLVLPPAAYMLFSQRRRRSA